MAKVTLLGSLASSVGGVVTASWVGAAVSSVSLQANAQVSAATKLEVSAKAGIPKTKSRPQVQKPSGRTKAKSKHRRVRQ